MSSSAQVLIVGAGPTGLVLAFWLNRLGVRVRVFDKIAEPGTTSRALAVHARTLEFYRQLGLADEVVRGGLPFTAANFWARRRRAGRAELGAMGVGLSPFPYVLIYPQDVHERFLIDRLAREGVRVERPVELLGFEESGERIVARLRSADATEETCEADYVAGCDGAHSTVRDVLGFGFAGGTYDRMFYVADVEASGPVMNRELNLVLDDADFLAVFPLPRPGNARFIGTVPVDAAANTLQTLTWQDVAPALLQRLKVNVERVNWFSKYRVHHRVAERYRRGRAFLLGDAAHIHSPVGGQGMNTGIGDAVNLAWKLAAALHAAGGGTSVPPELLDTYETERIAFAHRLVATTDRAFTFITRDGPLARLVRVDVVPRILPAVFRRENLRRLMWRTVSQIAINYRGGWLSEGAAGEVQGGDRLPWVPTGTEDGDDNFRSLKSLEWQVHVYGECAPGTAALCRRRGIDLQVFPWNAAAARARLKRGAIYVVRPDGYVGMADPQGDTAELEEYLTTRAARI